MVGIGGSLFFLLFRSHSFVCLIYLNQSINGLICPICPSGDQQRPPRLERHVCFREKSRWLGRDGGVSDSEVLERGKEGKRMHAGEKGRMDRLVSRLPAALILPEPITTNTFEGTCVVRRRMGGRGGSRYGVVTVGNWCCVVRCCAYLHGAMAFFGVLAWRIAHVLHIRCKGIYLIPSLGIPYM